MSVAQLKKAIKKHVSDSGSRQAVQLYRTVQNKKSGAVAYRLNPALIAPSGMSVDDRRRAAAELRTILGALEDAPA